MTGIRRTPFVALVFALTLPSASASGQSIDGRAIDESRDRPIPAAAVTLLDREGEARARTLSDARGGFEIVPPSEGEFYLRVEAPGYVTTTSPLLALTTDGRRQLEIVLEPEPLGIDGVDVEVEDDARQQLELYGLTPNRLGARWIGREDLERTPQSADASQTIRWRGIPGIAIAPRGAVSEGPPGLCVVFLPSRRCAAIYLNGVKIPGDEAIYFAPDELEAIAILEPRDAATFFGTEGGAGAVLMWTRNGGPF